MSKVFPESRRTKAVPWTAAIRTPIVATGSPLWRRDGVRSCVISRSDGMDCRRTCSRPMTSLTGAPVKGPVLVYDDVSTRWAASSAEKLRPGASTCWRRRLQVGDLDAVHRRAVQRCRRAAEDGVKLVLTHKLEAWRGDHAELASIYTGQRTAVEARPLVCRHLAPANDALFRDLKADAAGRT